MSEAVAAGLVDALDLPSVIHDFPAAVLMLDLSCDDVIFANDLARQLAPDLPLPATTQQWSTAAGLQVVGGGPLGASTTPLGQVAVGNPREGRQVSAKLGSEASTAREALWVIGLPLHTAPEPLRQRALLVLLPLRFPTAIADLQHAAATDTAHRSVLAADLAIAISDPHAEADDGSANPLVWVNTGFERVTGYSRAEVLGRNCRFLQGPDTDPAVVARMSAALTAEESFSETVLNYRHDGTAFYNHLTLSPVRDAAGHLKHYVSIQTDVTQRVLAQHERERADAMAADRYQRADHARAEAERSQTHGQLLLTLSQALAATSTVEDVAATVARLSAAELGTTGSGLLLLNPARTRLTFTSTDRLPVGVTGVWEAVSIDAPVSTARAARTRTPAFFTDRHAMLAANPALVGRDDVPAMEASAYLPLLLGSGLVQEGAQTTVVGVLALTWSQPRTLDEGERVLLKALAGYTAQAVQRALLLAERRTSAQLLQESLLTQLPQPDHLELRARYVPAATGEQVGGDWYDAVVLPDGATALVIGDVTGHDMAAAAHMGQMRGLLRAFAYDRIEPVTEVVARLDRALLGLGITGLATLVLARIEQTPADAAAGLRRLRWTNAGHLPPVLLLADGSTQVLDSVPEMLIGVAPDAPRSVHTAPLPPGSTLLLYTDGLVEHRGRSIDDGIADLRRVLTACADCTTEELLDRVVTELVGPAPDDDCAILAVRAHPEDAPRPPEAGPNRIP